MKGLLADTRTNIASYMRWNASLCARVRRSPLIDRRRRRMKTRISSSFSTERVTTGRNPSTLRRAPPSSRSCCFASSWAAAGAGVQDAGVSDCEGDGADCGARRGVRREGGREAIRGRKHGKNARMRSCLRVACFGDMMREEALHTKQDARSQMGASCKAVRCFQGYE